MGRYEVTYDNPTLGDVEVDVQGVGRIPNGGYRVVDLTDEQVQNIKDSVDSFIKVKKAGKDTMTTTEEEQQVDAEIVAELPATGEEQVEAQEQTEEGGEG